MKSIHKRLVLTLMAGLSALMLIGSVLLYAAMREALYAEFDYALAAKARALTMLPEAEGTGVNLRFIDQKLPEYERQPHPEYYQVWLRDGSVLARSPSLGDSSLPLRAGSLARPQFWSLTLPNGRPGRAAGIGWERVEAVSPLSNSPDYAVTTVFARETAYLDHKLARMGFGFLAGGFGLMFLMAGILARGVRAGLKPLHAMADHVAALDPESLDLRFPLDSLPVELKPIGDGLNRLMDRLHAAFQRERRFTDNVAHELATPISELRSLSEVALKWQEDPEATRQVAEESLEIAKQMQRILQALLALARSEAGQYEFRREPVNVSALLEEVQASLSSRIEEKGLSWETEVQPGLVADTDPAICKSMFTNLLENAVEYTPEQGRVRCRLQAVANRILFCIFNTQDSLSPEDLPFVSEPLWRKSTARTEAEHSGLGLSLVKSFAERLGLKLSIEITRPDQFSVGLSFPPIGENRLPAATDSPENTEAHRHPPQRSARVGHKKSPS